MSRDRVAGGGGGVSLPSPWRTCPALTGTSEASQTRDTDPIASKYTLHLLKK